MSAQDHQCADAGAHIPRSPQPRYVPCDLCGLAMPLPDHCKRRGVILGLLVCTACVEDSL